MIVLSPKRVHYISSTISSRFNDLMPAGHFNTLHDTWVNSKRNLISEQFIAEGDYRFGISLRDTSTVRVFINDSEKKVNELEVQKQSNKPGIN